MLKITLHVFPFVRAPETLTAWCSYLVVTQNDFISFILVPFLQLTSACDLHFHYLFECLDTSHLALKQQHYLVHGDVSTFV